MAYKKIIPYINAENEVLANVLKQAKVYSDSGADELYVYNFSKDEKSREEFLGLVKDIAKQIDIPLQVGCYISRMEDIKKALYTGAHRVVISYSQTSNMELIADGVERFGSMKIMVLIDMLEYMVENSDLANKLGQIGVSSLMLKHVGLTSGSIDKIKESPLPVIIRDSLIRNEITSLITLDTVEGVSTNFYENKDIMKIKIALKNDGIAVNSFHSKMAFAEFKLNSDGLIPVITQDYKTGEVLMLAYMNEEAYNKTIATGKMTYFSRSRQSLWIKGETSGHYQYVKELVIDCDSDTLLCKIRQVGPACHTGQDSCFYTKLVEKEYKNGDTSKVFEEVLQTILERKKNPKEGSYTNYLFDKGIDKILKKCGEESAEIIIAAKNPNAHELRYEIADYLYHLMVLMAECGLDWSDITNELVNRK